MKNEIENEPATLLAHYQIYPTRHDVPEDISAFQADVYGPHAIARAVIELLTDGGIAAFACCNRPPGGRGTAEMIVHHVMRFGIGEVEGKRCFRWVGESNDPNGTGSSSVVPTWYSTRLDAATVAAVITHNAGGREVFRITPEARCA